MHGEGRGREREGEGEETIRLTLVSYPLQSPIVNPYETPFVVRLQNAATLCDPLPCFTFTHPNHGELNVCIGSNGVYGLFVLYVNTIISSQ